MSRWEIISFYVCMRDSPRGKATDISGPSMGINDADASLAKPNVQFLTHISAHHTNSPSNLESPGMAVRKVQKRLGLDSKVLIRKIFHSLLSEGAYVNSKLCTFVNKFFS